MVLGDVVVPLFVVRLQHFDEVDVVADDDQLEALMVSPGLNEVPEENGQSCPKETQPKEVKEVNEQLSRKYS